MHFSYLMSAKGEPSVERMSCEKPLRCEDGAWIMKASGFSRASLAIDEVNSSSLISVVPIDASGLVGRM